MKNLFKQNDVHCKRAVIFTYIMLFIVGVLMLVAAILMFRADEVAAGIIMLISDAIIVVAGVFFANLMFSVIYDLKFIRNKLYNLEEMNGDLTGSGATHTTSEQPADAVAELSKLSDLLQSGAITQEEFDAQKIKLLK